MKQIVMNFTKHPELVQIILIVRRKHKYHEQYKMVDGLHVLTPFRPKSCPNLCDFLDYNEKLKLTANFALKSTEPECSEVTYFKC